MWTRGVAIRPVPPHAIVEARTIELVRDAFDDDDDAQAKLDEAFTRFEQTQPALSGRLEDALERRGIDDTARTLGYFLGVSVWLAFDRQFDNRLGRVDETAARAASAALELESELRAESERSIELDAEDIIAREQPALMAFVHEHVDVALESPPQSGASRGPDVDDVYAIYRVILVQLLSLSHAVSPHPGVPARRAEVLA